MSELVRELAESFTQWLSLLAKQAVAVSSVLTTPGVSPAVRRPVAGALGALAQSLEQMPEGLEDLGLIEGAFWLRVACKLALQQAAHPAEDDPHGALSHLAEQAVVVERFMERDYKRLEAQVRGLEKTQGEGWLSTDEARDALLAKLSRWAESYQGPSWPSEEKSLIKLRAFLAARLS